MSASIETARSGDALWIRFSDSATMTTAPLLLDCLADPAHDAVTEVSLDLSECPLLDSTFAGSLVGLVKKAKENRGPQIQLLNPSDACLRSLRQMSLDRLFGIQTSPFPEALEWHPYLSPSASCDHMAEVVIRAHEDLASTGPQNKHFGRIAEAFRKDHARQRQG